MTEITQLALRAREASRTLARTSTTVRNGALVAMAAALLAHADGILAANAVDMEAARVAGTAAPLLDRLMLDEDRIAGIASAVEALAREVDPIGQVVSGHRMPNGIQLRQVRVPLGVVAMIYEARPNVTADAAALCVKTANAAILRGGSLAIHSCLAISDVLAEAARSGMVKINIGTALNVAYTAAIRTWMSENPAGVDPRKYTAGARESVAAVVAHYLRLVAARAGDPPSATT